MSLALETISQSGVVPKSVIKDATSARQIFTTLFMDDAPSNQMRAQIEGMLDGNPPFNDQELIDLGQAGRTNCNWGTARARVNAAKQPHYDLLTSVPQYATVKTDFGGPKMCNEYSRIISEEFHRTLDAWDEFLEQMEIHQQELVTHGIGPMFWRDEKDWRAKALLRRNMLVPSNAKSSRNNQNVVYIRDSMDAHEVYRYISNPEVAAATGWNVQWAKKAIIQSGVNQEERQRDWEWWQAQFKDNNYYMSYSRTKEVNIVHALVKELDGRVSHHIFTRNPLSTKGGKDTDDYIYSKIGRFEEMNQVIWMCFDGVGNGDFKSVRGLGNEVFHFGEASNRMNNGICDGVIRALCTMWQAETAADAQKFMAIEIGPDRLLPPGFKAVPMTAGMAGNIKSAIEVASYFQMMESSNTGQYRASLDSKDGNPITATEAQMQAGDKAAMTSSKTEHYLRAADRFYYETVRRMCNRKLVRNVDPGANEALDFQQRCFDRGVPENIFDWDEKANRFKYIVSVKATRGIGNGSVQGRIVAMQNMMPLVLSRSPEAQQRNLINDLIGAWAGNQYSVEQYGIPADVEQPGEDEWEATMENNAFLMGGQVIIADGQNDFTHATYHINFMAGTIQDVQNGGIDPIKASLALDDAGPHTLQHMARLAGDPTRKQALAQFKQQMGQITRQADEVRQAAKQMEAEQQKAQQSQQPKKVTEVVSVAYKDIPPENQQELLAELGFTPTNQKSVPEQNIDLKRDQLALKEQKQQVDITKTRQNMVLDDVKTADQIKNSHVTRKVALQPEPKPKTNGSKK